MNARAIMIAKIATGEIDDAPDPAAKALSKKGGPKAARVEELAGDSVYPATGNAGGSARFPAAVVPPGGFTLAAGVTTPPRALEATDHGLTIPPRRSGIYAAHG
jgi:hypothetical protein